MKKINKIIMNLLTNLLKKGLVFSIEKDDNFFKLN